jgi:putative transcriptional regulator
VRNVIRRPREQAGLSQGELATALDVSRQTVNAIETGRYNPTLPLAMRIARYFGTLIEEIFHDHEPVHE